MSEQREAALKSALSFAEGAIEDAIYAEEGLDGDAGQRVLHIIREAVEHGTFDQTTPPVEEPPTRRELLLALSDATEAARAAVRYDEAIQSCANDPEKMASFCTATDETLDDLYEDWITKARAALGATK